MPYFKYEDKNVYYNKVGEGRPLFLLHGNAASSKMFDFVLDKYIGNNTVILIDFLGHGKSDRLKKFKTDFWDDHALQLITLVETLGLREVDVIGTSGGAVIAVNAGLRKPELFRKLVLDSCDDGRCFSKEAYELVRKEREENKENKDNILFLEYCHGTDWEAVVDNDTDMLRRNIGRKMFCDDIENLSVPSLFTGTKEDELILDSADLPKEFASRVKDGKYHIFDKGGHPAVLSAADEFYEAASKFLAH